MPYHILCLPLLPLRMILLLVVMLGVYTHWYQNLVGFLLWLEPSNLIQHFLLALLRLERTLLSFLCELYMVFSYCITVLNWVSFSL